MTATEPGFSPDAPAGSELLSGLALPDELALPEPALSGESVLLARWWEELPQGRRRPLLLLRAGDPLPQAVATELWRLGVSCPLILVAEGGRLVRRTLPPPALQELLARQGGGEES